MEPDVDVIQLDARNVLEPRACSKTKPDILDHNYLGKHRGCTGGHIYATRLNRFHTILACRGCPLLIDVQPAVEHFDQIRQYFKPTVTTETTDFSLSANASS